MTREEAINHIVELCNAIQLNPKTSKGQAVNMAIKALEQEPILDKIRAEIPKLTCGDNEYRQALVKVADVIKCINKHRAESEVQDADCD